jgi:hypothetical protein
MSKIAPDHLARAAFVYQVANNLECLYADAGELCGILGDGVNQAADFSSLATSMPSRNVTPLTTFGN